MEQITRALYCNPIWSRIFPFLRWWPMVTRQTLKADLIAGLTGAVVVLPPGVAFLSSPPGLISPIILISKARPLCRAFC